MKTKSACAGRGDNTTVFYSFRARGEPESTQSDFYVVLTRNRQDRIDTRKYIGNYLHNSYYFNFDQSYIQTERPQSA